MGVGVGMGMDTGIEWGCRTGEKRPKKIAMFLVGGRWKKLVG